MKQTTNLETKVGIFLMLGIGLICTLIILFGEVPDLFKPTYTLTVTFPNAAGLLRGSDVYLSGALIGKVTTDPHPIPDTQTVEVNLKIDKNVGIRQNASYVIGSSGLLGDKFVEVRPVVYPDGTSEEKKAPFVYDGEQIKGATGTDMEKIMSSAEPLIDKANDIADQLDEMIRKLNLDVFSGTSTDDLKETIAKLRHMVDNGDSMISNANDLLAEAKTGKGVLGRLINDKQVGDNLAAFIANLKSHGPIFYHDDTGDKDKGNNNSDDDSRKKKQ
ncbi:MAG TPA: MlaD family protein [Candidatus Methylacidiphilales bacterium]|jgi:ABC-type transporter Mla subunit MlaD|nr:MlaD family protein [Candidatus Methylacidiphilales bacterium]